MYYLLWVLYVLFIVGTLCHRRILGMASGGAEAHFLPEFFRRQNLNIRHGIWRSETVRICANDLI